MVGIRNIGICIYICSISSGTCSKWLLTVLHVSVNYNHNFESTVSLDYKTTPWDGRKWSYIAGGLLIKGYIQDITCACNKDYMQLFFFTFL